MLHIRSVDKIWRLLPFVFVTVLEFVSGDFNMPTVGLRYIQRSPNGRSCEAALQRGIDQRT